MKKQLTSKRMYGIRMLTDEKERDADMRSRERGSHMLALMEAPEVDNCSKTGREMGRVCLDELVVAMGKRLQAEYIDGAIPYLRKHEAGLWAQLEALDRDESLEALLAYERLFFEGLRRYVSHLEARRQAA
jgi:hypothetical protein